MSSLDDNEIVPYTTHNGIKIRKYVDLALESSNMMPHKKGHLVLLFNISLGTFTRDRMFRGKTFMDQLKDEIPEAYLFTLGYFGGHDFTLDLNR